MEYGDLTSLAVDAPEGALCSVHERERELRARADTWPEMDGTRWPTGERVLPVLDFASPTCTREGCDRLREPGERYCHGHGAAARAVGAEGCTCCHEGHPCECCPEHWTPEARATHALARVILERLVQR